MKPSLSRVRHRALFNLQFAALVLPLALMWTQTTAQAGGVLAHMKQSAVKAASE